MDSKIMVFWVNGKIGGEIKINNGEYSFKNQPSNIPPFHYSIFEASVQAFKNVLFFN